MEEVSGVGVGPSLEDNDRGCSRTFLLASVPDSIFGVGRSAFDVPFSSDPRLSILDPNLWSLDP